MASLSITEYSSLASYPTGAFLTGKEPALARQAVTYTTSAQSAALNAATRFVRLVADADVYLAFGTNPTADATSTLLKANSVEYLGVEPGQSLKIAAYDGTS